MQRYTRGYTRGDVKMIWECLGCKKREERAPLSNTAITHGYCEPCADEARQQLARDLEALKEEREGRKNK
ncbi:MAG: hypothetical protein COU33_04215 [Candidatus Magasanikbacteria bacterium CG10_big_fil_rev_8_21_14_0_10_43_6]|uniref:Uncharacterized protein n=1 Tax=Candidatus Magasanikbacteria bacterium CG10_big_fil_rev_8_21_14_0_10_43_6 TaxID=1974650 RepID=A0A2M6W0B5_9BACT|nr:MAG: hypothetical protein COU33_04215 [Candidatus Magasanikbacteria bacterium CG10_big_fil_rev_8_21_14_0_10_43_6]